ncbi:hypothetical protein [Mesomycoplasma hyopneumoniae]|uniref:hypothetical protein n=1 Tax=Mesomycoplasma hyopneumoniae TaxID=2099 RepID=UPI003265A43E
MIKNLRKNLKKTSLFFGIFGFLGIILTTNTTTVSVRSEKARAYSNGFSTQEIIASLLSNSLNPFSILSGFALLKSGINDKYVELKNDDAEMQVSIFGGQFLVYLGGLFWEDKVSWATDVEVKYKPEKQKNNLNKLKKVEGRLNVWTSGIGSPSFQVGAELRYNGTFMPTATAKMGINFDTKELEIVKTADERSRALISFAGVGWRYKITSYGQHTTGIVEGDENFANVNTENTAILTPRRKKPKTSFQELFGKYIQEKYGHLKDDID